MRSIDTLEELELENQLERYLEKRQPRAEFVVTLGRKLSEKPDLVVIQKTRYRKAVLVVLLGLVTGVMLAWIFRKRV